MVQILASILFFYVFILGAILLTGYIIWIIIRYSKDQQKRK